MIPCALIVDRDESKRSLRIITMLTINVIHVRHNAVSRFTLNFFSVDCKKKV